MPVLKLHLATVSNHDGAAVLDISRNQITTLNETGTFVWNRLQQGHAIEQIIHDLAAEFRTTPARVEPGVLAFLERLKAEQLLQD